MVSSGWLKLQILLRYCKKKNVKWHIEEKKKKGIKTTTKTFFYGFEIIIFYDFTPVCLYFSYFFLSFMLNLVFNFLFVGVYLSPDFEKCVCWWLVILIALLWYFVLFCCLVRRWLACGEFLIVYTTLTEKSRPTSFFMNYI